MELKKLIYTVDEDGIAVITMNYMKNLNAIDEQMADELMYVVDAAEKDPNVKVVVLNVASLSEVYLHTPFRYNADLNANVPPCPQYEP